MGLVQSPQASTIWRGVLDLGIMVSVGLWGEGLSTGTLVADP